MWTSLTVIKHGGVLVFVFFFKSVFLGPFFKKLLIYLISAVLGLLAAAPGLSPVAGAGAAPLLGCGLLIAVASSLIEGLGSRAWPGRVSASSRSESSTVAPGGRAAPCPAPALYSRCCGRPAALMILGEPVSWQPS